MRKAKINLLSDRQDYTRLERYFLYFRIGVLAYAVILFSVAAVLTFSLFNQNDKIQALSNQKKSFLTTMSGGKNEEAKLAYLSKKMDAYGQFIKDDARFLPYFTLLNNALKTSSQSAVLSSFLIDKDRDVEFTLSFGRLEDLLKSFEFVESDQFLKNFEQLSLTQFLSQKNKAQINYEISFEGKFIKLDEKN